MILPITKISSNKYPTVEIGELLFVESKFIELNGKMSLAVSNSKSEALGFIAGKCLTHIRVVDLLNKKSTIKIFAIFKNHLLIDITQNNNYGRA